MPAGYSNTPLFKKLGIKPDFCIYLVNAPKHYIDLLERLPEGVRFDDHPKQGSVDFIHLFVTERQDLERHCKSIIPLIKSNGLFWVSWPKGTSKIKSEIKRDDIRNHLLDIGLVDVKVAAVDADWSGLKFVYRLKDRN